MRRPSEKGQEKRKSGGLDDSEVDDHGDPWESEYLPLDTTHSQAFEPSPPPTNTEELEPNAPKRPKMTHKKIHVSDSNAQEELERLEAELQKESPDKKFVKKAMESTFAQRRRSRLSTCGGDSSKVPCFQKVKIRMYA